MSHTKIKNRASIYGSEGKEEDKILFALQKLKTENSKGISLLFTVLITSLILAISLGISALLIQEMRMMGEIGYSVIAFYAADSGIEHALYRFYQEGWTGSLTNPDPSYKAYVTVVPPETATLRPSGEGETGLNSVPDTYLNFQCVNEEIPDGGDTYVYYSSPLGKVRDLYELEYSYPIDPFELEQIKTKSIAQVIVYFNVAQFGTGATATPSIKPSGYDSDDGEPVVPTDSWNEYSQTWLINPGTGLVWAWNEIDNLQAGIVLAGGFVPLCTQVYVEVTTREEVHIKSSGVYQNTTRAIEASYFK